MAVQRKFQERYEASLSKGDVWVWEDPADGSISIGVVGRDGLRFASYHTFQGGADWVVSLEPVPMRRDAP